MSGSTSDFGSMFSDPALMGLMGAAGGFARHVAECGAGGSCSAVHGFAVQRGGT